VPNLSRRTQVRYGRQSADTSIGARNTVGTSLIISYMSLSLEASVVVEVRPG